MAGLPKHFAKMGFKKGWAAFKRSRHGHRSHRMHGCTSMSGRGRKRGRSRVHHAMWLDGDMTKPALISRPVNRLSKITPSKIFSPVVDIVLLVAGMAVGAAVKKMVPIKNPHLMNGTQTVVGVGGSLMTKNRFVKMPLLGVALQSVISESKLVFPKIPLAGDDEVVYLEDMSGETPQIEYTYGADRVSGAEDIRGDDDLRGDDEETVYGFDGGEGGETGE